MLSELKKLFYPFITPFLIIVGVTLYWSYLSGEVRTLDKQIDRSNEIALHTEKIMSLLKDTETGVRGFMFLQDSVYLQPFHQAKGAMGEYVAELSALIPDTSSQRFRFERLLTLGERRIRYLDTMLMLRPKVDLLNQPDIIRIAGQGKSTMDMARNEVETIVAFENEYAEKIIRDKGYYSEQAKIVQWMIFIFGFGILLFACWRLFEELQTRLEYAQRLEDSVKLLQYNNEELEALSFTFAHHFQEPLRKMTTFADRLTLIHGEELSEGAAHSIRKIESLSKEMRQLVESVQRVTAIRNRAIGESYEVFSLAEAVEASRTHLSEELRVSKARLELSALDIFIQGDKRLITKLFLQMIRNAFQFAAPGRDPIIQINASKVKAIDLPDSNYHHLDRDYIKVEVQDNGLGFDMAYKEQIFNIFQKIDPAKQSDGNGIGLTMCRQIVRNHGGLLNVNSKLGQGTVFYIYLPANVNNNGKINQASTDFNG